MNILIVDDSKEDRKGIKNTFNQIEFKSQTTFYEADNGESGMNVVLDQGKKIDLILVDIEMPDMDGIHFIRNLNHQTIEPKPPVFVISHHSTKERVLEAKEAKAKVYIKKPLRSDVLLAKLEDFFPFQIKKTTPVSDKLKEGQRVLCYETDIHMKSELIDQLEKIGLTRIYFVDQLTNIEDMILRKSITLIIIGPSIPSGFLENTMKVIKRAGGEKLPIFPIVKDMPDKSTLSLYEKLGLKVYVPIFEPGSWERLGKIISRQSTSSMPDQVSYELSGAVEFTIQVISNGYQINFGIIPNEAVLKNLKAELVVYYTKHKYTAFTFNLSFIPSDKIDLDLLKSLVKNLDFLSDPAQSTIKYLFPPNFDVGDRLSKLREIFSHKFL